MNDMPVYLAQVLDPTWGEWLLSQGVLGFVVAVLLYFVIKKDKALSDSYDARLKDLNELKTLIKDQTIALQASNIAENERNRALEVSARVAEKSTVILDQISRDLADVRGKVDTQ